jgi:hypothetical protein
MTLHNLSKNPRPEPSTLSLVYKSYKRPKYAYDRVFQPPHMAELRMKQDYITQPSQRVRARIVRLELMRAPMPKHGYLRKGKPFARKSGALAWRRRRLKEMGKLSKKARA